MTPFFFNFCKKGFLYTRLFITMAVLWTVNDFFYVAGTLNAENLSGDIFINFSLISLTEMPSVFIGQFLIGKFSAVRRQN